MTDVEEVSSNHSAEEQQEQEHHAHAEEEQTEPEQQVVPATPAPARPVAPIETTLNVAAWAGKVTRPAAPTSETVVAVRQAHQALLDSQMSRADDDLTSALQATREAQDAKGKAVGAWGVVRGAFLKGVSHAVAASSRGVEATMGKISSVRFNRNFPDAAGDALLAVFTAQALHNGMPITGSIFVTDKHVCYHNGGTIRAAFALEDVVSVVLCISMNTYEGRPHLIPSPDPTVLSESMQLFLRDRSVVEFINIQPDAAEATSEFANHRFKHNRAAAMCHATIYDAWAKVVGEVPVPGVEYSDM
jgi:hypothetical protein